MSTLFTIVFGLACLATFVCSVRKEWKGARMAAALIAILSFLLALATVSTR